MRLISVTELSTKAFGLMPASAAFNSIFCPCSSVPVWKNTSYPSSLLKRAIASAKTIS